MIAISSDMYEILNQPTRVIETRITINGNHVITGEHIQDFSVEYQLTDDGSYMIGSAVSQKLNLVVLRVEGVPSVWVNLPIEVEVGVCDEVGVMREEDATSFTWFKMGTFYAKADGIKKDKFTYTITAYDAIQEYDNKTFVYPTKQYLTTNELIHDIEGQTQLQVENKANLPNCILHSPMGEISLRETLRVLGQVLGRNAIINRNGNLEFILPASAPFGIDGENYQSFNLEAEDIQKLGILTIKHKEYSGEEEAEVSYSVGVSGCEFTFENSNITTQQEAVLVYQHASLPYSYYGYKLSCQGFPHLELGDIINLTDEEGNEYELVILTHNFKYTGGIESEFGAVPYKAQTASASSSTGSISNTIINVQSDLLETRKLVAAAIEADEAKINEISADLVETKEVLAKKVSTEDLEAVDVKVQGITGELAEFAKLVTGEAEITDASIIQLKVDNATIENGLITDAMIQSLSADKITSGTLDTQVVNISGANGNFMIRDNTLQIIDENDVVRVQMGLFGNEAGDTYIYNLGIYDAEGNEIFNALGLSEGTIRDWQVSDDANISAHKIDINTLFKVINEATNGETILASKILLDETTNTLDILFKQLQENSDNTSTQVQINTDGIAQLTQKIEGDESSLANVVSTVDGITATYSQVKEDIDGIKQFNKAYFDANATGVLTIGQLTEGASGFAKMELDTEEVRFRNAQDEVVAYFGTNGFETTKGIITTGNITIGNFAFVPRANGSLDFKKVR